MQSCGDFIDFKTIDTKDLDLGRVAVKAQDKNSKHKNLPPDRIIRYNFLEVLIRLGGQKAKKGTPWNEAIERLMEEYISKYFT